MDNTLISVIVPVYNTQKYLDRCIMSLVNQNCDNIEIILINDGSTDNSLEICRKYIDKYPNIKLYNKSNTGLGDTRNYGLAKASGEYVAFVDSDDFVDKNMYRYLGCLAKEYSADIVSSYYEMVTDCKCEGKIEAENIKPYYTTDNYEMINMYMKQEISASPCDKIYKKDFLLRSNILFPKGTYYEEIFTVVNMLHKCKSIVSIDNKFYKYYLRDDSITQGISTKRYNDYRNETRRCQKLIEDNYLHGSFSIEFSSLKFLHMSNMLKMIKELHKEESVKECFENIDFDIIIFGASSAGQIIKYYSDMFKVNIKYFTDNNKDKWHKKFEDIEVIPPMELKDIDFSTCKIIIASMYFREIYMQLCEYGVEDNIAFLDI